MTDYRDSHSAEGYGLGYEDAYDPDTFYGQLWREVEMPLLRETMIGLREKGATSCLDFACGTGRILQVAAEEFDETVGVDVSEAMLSRARINAPNSQLLQQDLTNTPLDRQFDVVTAFRFFRNAQPQLREEAIAALAKHLRPGGHLVVNTHGNPNAPAIMALKLKAKTSNIQANSLSHSALASLLESSGLSVVSTTHYSYLPRIGNAFPSWYGKLMIPAEKLTQIPVLREVAESSLIVARLNAD